MSTAQASLRTVVVAGVGMTAFGKFLDRSIKSLVAESVQVDINARRDVAVGTRGLAFLRRWYRPDVDATDPLIVLRDDSVRATERVRAAGVPARLEVYPLAPHAWHQLGTGLPETRAAVRHIVDFVETDCVLAPPIPAELEHPGHHPPNPRSTS